MIKSIIAFVIFCIIATNLFSQLPEGYPVISKTDLPYAKFSPVRTFNGESLYGYIDGGADLYLEYGFTGAIVTEFVYLKRKYKIEVYKMCSSEAAFGIFSVSRFRCRTRPAFSTYTCQNKYQLQICCGEYYINILNESGTGADSTVSILVGKKIVEKITEPSVNLPGSYPEFLMKSCKIKPAWSKADWALSTVPPILNTI